MPEKSMTDLCRCNHFRKQHDYGTTATAHVCYANGCRCVDFRKARAKVFEVRAKVTATSARIAAQKAGRGEFDGKSVWIGETK